VLDVIDAYARRLLRYGRHRPGGDNPVVAKSANPAQPKRKKAVPPSGGRPRARFIGTSRDVESGVWLARIRPMPCKNQIQDLGRASRSITAVRDGGCKAFFFATYEILNAYKAASVFGRSRRGFNRFKAGQGKPRPLSTVFRGPAPDFCLTTRSLGLIWRVSASF